MSDSKMFFSFKRDLHDVSVMLNLVKNRNNLNLVSKEKENSYSKMRIAYLQIMNAVSEFSHSFPEEENVAASKVFNIMLSNNLKRLNHNVGYDITDLPEPQAIFQSIHSQGVPIEEMYRVFNMGTGFVVILDEKDVDSALEILEKYFKTQVIGKVTNTPEEVKVKTYTEKTIITDNNCEIRIVPKYNESVRNPSTNALATPYKIIYK